jgi:hypothetical protein
MPIGNGYLSRQNLPVYMLAALIGGGGAVGGTTVAGGKLERRVDEVEATQREISVKLENIEKNQERIEKGVNKKLDDVLEAIEEIDQ